MYVSETEIVLLLMGKGIIRLGSNMLCRSEFSIFHDNLNCAIILNVAICDSHFILQDFTFKDDFLHIGWISLPVL